MEGSVDRSGLPFVVLEVAQREWKATIDTGFNGDVELPLELFSHVQPRFEGRAPSYLAANQSVFEDYYMIRFPFDGQVVEALATFVPGDIILIGTRLLRDYSLNIDFPTNRVVLERSI